MSIIFPSAFDHQSKLSTSPSTKIPNSANWVLQDFLDSVADTDDILSSTSISDVFPDEFEKHNSLIFENFYELYNEDETMGDQLEWEDSLNTPPILIESNLSSCTISSASLNESFISYQYPAIIDNPIITKRRSNSSFSSFRSFINVFHINKKSKTQHVELDNTSQKMKHNTVPLTKSEGALKSKISKRLTMYFKF